MSGRVVIVISEGSQQGREFTFDSYDTLIVGRMDDCHVCIPDDNRVSRHHCILEMNPPDVRLRDLGSRNGTYVNGTRYSGRERAETPEEAALRDYPEVALQDGDEIRVGRTVMQVRVEALEAAPEPVFCQRCGRDVSDEVGPARSGNYICSQCQRQIKIDPMVLMQRLLQEAAQKAAQRAAPGPRVPDYVIERKLGEGGMGVVYLVHHQTTGEPAALKIMLPRVAVDERAVRLFEREMEVTRQLHHPNIVEFYDHGVSGSMFYFLMEFCPDGSVDRLMDQYGGRLPLKVALPIMLDALNGLAYAHEQGYVHRDLKPQNILLVKSNGRQVAKLGDMGMAKNFQEAGLSGFTQTGQFAGTFPFMPREQVVNYKYYRPVSDVWAMGATLYNMLTGAYPREHRRGQDPMVAILQGEVIPIRKRDASIPRPAAEVIDRCLAREPRDRYQDAGEMRRALERVM